MRTILSLALCGSLAVLQPGCVYQWMKQNTTSSDAHDRHWALALSPAELAAGGGLAFLGYACVTGRANCSSSAPPASGGFGVASNVSSGLESAGEEVLGILVLSTVGALLVGSGLGDLVHGLAPAQPDAGNAIGCMGDYGCPSGTVCRAGHCVWAPTQSYESDGATLPGLAGLDQLGH